MSKGDVDDRADGATGETASSRGTLTLALAAFGAVAAVVAVVLAIGARGGKTESGIPDRPVNTNLPADVERDVRTAVADQMKRELQETKEQWDAGRAQLERWKNEMAETITDAAKKGDAAIRGIEARIGEFEEQGRGFVSSLKDIADVKQALKDLAVVVKELKDRPVAVAQGPPIASGTGGATPPPPPPVSSGPTPEDIAANKEKAKQALSDLSNDDAGTVFNATIVLGRYGGPEAVEPLVKVLKTHKDFYPRMGAATALGQLKACDAVVALIDTVLDKESNVFIAANQALIAIMHISEKDLTEEKLVISADTSKVRRGEMKLRWVAYWRAHE